MIKSERRKVEAIEKIRRLTSKFDIDLSQLLKSQPVINKGSRTPSREKGQGGRGFKVITGAIARRVEDFSN